MLLLRAADADRYAEWHASSIKTTEPKGRLGGKNLEVVELPDGRQIAYDPKAKARGSEGMLQQSRCLTMREKFTGLL